MSATFPVGTWTDLGWKRNNNGNIDFYINHVYMNTISSNIPTGSANAGLVARISGVGTMDTDYIGYATSTYSR